MMRKKRKPCTSFLRCMLFDEGRVFVREILEINDNEIIQKS